MHEIRIYLNDNLIHSYKASEVPKVGDNIEYEDYIYVVGYVKMLIWKSIGPVVCGDSNIPETNPELMKHVYVISLKLNTRIDG